MFDVETVEVCEVITSVGSLSSWSSYVLMNNSKYWCVPLEIFLVELPLVVVCGQETRASLKCCCGPLLKRSQTNLQSELVSE